MFFIITSLVVLAVVLPSFVWLLFFLKEDLHPEPKRLIIYVFSLGALSTIPVLLIQLGINSFLNVIALTAPSVLVLAFTEEIFKFFAAYFGVRKNPAFDEPMDAMIYMVTAALGFATIENLFIVSNILSTAGLASLLAALNVLLLRFIGATLLHVLASALLGFYWAKKKIAAGIIIATAVHGIFNYLIVIFPNNNLFYASLFLIIPAFFVFQDFERLKV
jgi:protease PrsW